MTQELGENTICSRSASIRIPNHPQWRSGVGAQTDEHLELSPIEVQWACRWLRISIPHVISARSRRLFLISILFSTKPLPQRPWKLGMIPPVAESSIPRCGDTRQTLAHATNAVENLQRGKTVQNLQKYLIGKERQIGHAGCVVHVIADCLGIGRHFVTDSCHVWRRNYAIQSQITVP